MIIFSGRLSVLQLLPLLGIFLLASGASALNQFQERNTDAKMERTKSRPLPSGSMRRITVLYFSFFLIIAGSSLLSFTSSTTCLILGLVNILWYNGIYTPLKKLTAFAVVPGALTGAIPVYMGWTALGGSLLDPTATLLAFFIFIWQVPHFWLLMLEYHEDYNKAGLATITNVFSTMQVRSVILGWLIASAASSFLLIHFGIFHSHIIRILIVLMNIAILSFFTLRFLRREDGSYRAFFILINVFMMLVLLLAVIDVVIKSP